MEKIETNEITVKQVIHKFYCDDCNKFLLESVEDKNGYFKEPQEYRIQHVILKGHHCRECALKRIHAVVDFAESNGFDMSNV